MACKKEVRKSIYNLVGRVDRAEIIRIFENQNISCRTIYRTIAECEQGFPFMSLAKRGRPRIFTQARTERLVRREENKVGTPLRKLRTERE